ncbi:DUF6043 family protein [Elizabethkingia anophelis]|uniref:DUF6043 family protein n=1 Tax=Elizabethkingia anophelis TaxID=1117645 RepID=UPI0035584FD4
MRQQELDDFIQQIKNWKESHPEEYDLFEEYINRKDNAGYEKIFGVATALIPKYQSLIKRKINQGFQSDISDIKKKFSENNLDESLIVDFEHIPENSIIPAMLSWLYFGKSYERMVERGEEMRKNGKLSSVEKQYIVSVIKQIIETSINSGLRTKSDWENHLKLMHLADSEDISNWVTQNSLVENKKVGRKAIDQDLPQSSLKEIENFIKNNNSQHDLACLKIALEEMGLSKPKEIKAFRDVLEEQYGNNINIISERGIQTAYRKLTEPFSTGEKYGKDIKTNREYIDKIKEILSR